MLSLLHFRGYMTGESAVWTYYDGNEQYYLAEDSLQRILCIDMSEDTVAADVEMILPLLTEWNPSGERSMTDWLTEMGYKKNAETTKRLTTEVPQNTVVSCVYKKDEDEIRISCDFSMHYLQIDH